MEVRTYPALVDRESSVDLALLESSAAAEAATRAGVRRLITLAARPSLSAVAPRIPPAFAHASGATASRAESDAFRARVLARIVDDAFRIGGDAELPRSRRAFEEIDSAGAPRVDSTFRLYANAIARASSELDVTLQVLRSAARHPTAKLAIAEIRAQLAVLFPADLVTWVPLGQLEHFPRYLRAAQTRLGRAIADPRKDAEKLAPLAPLWAAFLAKQTTARDREMVHALRWSFEELRVAVFAPELKTHAPVSLAKVTAAVEALR
jgi:ATP-dependent helicase HrpA